MNNFWNEPNLEIIEVNNSVPQLVKVNKSNSMDLLIATQNKIATISKKKIIYKQPIITRNDDPIIFPNTINVIQGKAGAHKSRLAEHFASLLLTKDLHNSILNFKANFLNSYTVIYVDTERNLSEQFPAALQSIRRNAGYSFDFDPPNFEFITLLETERENRLNRMSEYLEYIRQKYSNHIIIIIDVLTDCIKNFNDEKESLKFIDILNELINHFDITIIGVIHENPSKTDSKARGHIGTEITNKATTVFSVGYPSDKNNILEITFKKCRSSERYQPIYCKYEPNLKKLVEAENLEVQAMKQTKAQIEDVSLSLINILDTGAKERKEVISLLCPEFDCSERTITQRLSEIYQLNFLEKYGYVLVYDAAANNDRNKKLYSIKSLNQ